MSITNPVAHSDKGCQLWAWNETAGKYKYLVPVRAVPATGAAPSTIEVTEMDSPRKQYIFDRDDTSTMEFDYNYTADKYAACKAVLDGVTENKFLVTYPDGSGVKFEGAGKTWRDAVSTGGEIVGKISVAVLSMDDVDDCSSIVDASTVPAGRVSPFNTNEYTVSFNLNEGTGTAVASMTCASGGYITIPDCDAVLSSDDFNCWNTKADGSGENIAVGSKFYASANVTLYAKY